MAASTLNGTARSLGRLRDKIAIVTGGSSGIGRAIALAYAAEGARIVVADRDVQSKAISEIEVSTADIVRREHGQEVLFHQTDVSSSQSVDGLMSRTVEKYGRLDILVNAAGVAPEIHNPQPIWSLPEATWNMTMGVNATGILNTCRAATAQMMSQPARADGDRGWIVNISSIYGQTAVPGNVAYCSSKHAVLGLTKAAALDCAPHNIRINAICPGFTSTALTTSLAADPTYLQQIKSTQPLKGVGSAQDVARIAVVLASEDAGWMTGTAVAVDGGFLCQ